MRNSLSLVTVIIGTRPEAIKLAPVIKAFQSNNFFKVRVVLTGQHKELVDEVLDVPPPPPPRGSSSISVRSPSKKGGKKQKYTRKLKKSNKRKSRRGRR